TRYWDVATGKPLQSVLPEQRGRVVGLLFAPPNGKTVMVAVEGGPVRLFNADSGKELVRLPQWRPLAAAVFSSDGQALAVGSAASTLDGVKTDGEIQVWQVGKVLRSK